MTALFRNIITSGARRFIGLQPSQSYLSDGFANWPPSASLQPYLMLASNDMRNNPNKPFLSPQALDWFNHAIASAEYENGEDCHLSSLAIAELVAAQLLRFYLTGTPPCHQVVRELSEYWSVIERVSTGVNVCERISNQRSQSAALSDPQASLPALPLVITYFMFVNKLDPKLQIMLDKLADHLAVKERARQFIMRHMAADAFDQDSFISDLDGILFNSNDFTQRVSILLYILELAEGSKRCGHRAQEVCRLIMLPLKQLQFAIHIATDVNRGDDEELLKELDDKISTMIASCNLGGPSIMPCPFSP